MNILISNDSAHARQGGGCKHFGGQQPDPQQNCSHFSLYILSQGLSIHQILINPIILALDNSGNPRDTKGRVKIHL